MIIRLHYTNIEDGRSAEKFNDALYDAFAENLQEILKQPVRAYECEHYSLLYHNLSKTPATGFTHAYGDFRPRTEACKLWMMLNMPESAKILQRAKRYPEIPNSFWRSV